MLRSVWSICAFLCASALAGGAAAGSEEETWAALQRGGMVVIMRHASAPGLEQGAEGDPSGFKLEDCSTQRNLSTFGRSQATTLGEQMRAHRVVFTRVLSSPWCRAKDTAALMNLGPSIEIRKFLFNIADRAAAEEDLKDGMPRPMVAVHEIQGIIRAWQGPGNLMLVTHGRTAAAVVWSLRERSPEQAEPIVLEPAQGTEKGFREIGSLDPPGGDREAPRRGLHR